MVVHWSYSVKYRGRSMHSVQLHSGASPTRSNGPPQIVNLLYFLVKHFSETDLFFYVIYGYCILISGSRRKKNKEHQKLHVEFSRRRKESFPYYYAVPGWDGAGS